MAIEEWRPDTSNDPISLDAKLAYMKENRKIMFALMNHLYHCGLKKVEDDEKYERTIIKLEEEFPEIPLFVSSQEDLQARSKGLRDLEGKSPLYRAGDQLCKAKQFRIYTLLAYIKGDLEKTIRVTESPEAFVMQDYTQRVLDAYNEAEALQSELADCDMMQRERFLRFQRRWDALYLRE
ncbi:MAG: hypothetical protein ACE5FT_04140 [Candidatus Nanoarchaeia archaeon]